MMVSEQSRNVPSVASADALSSTSSSPTATAAATAASASMDPSTSMAMAFPTSLGNVTMADVAMMDAAAFAALPFDQLMNMPTHLPAHDPGAAAIHASFFIDTAAIAQQIAASVSDEKKLSDNILDLIPPPQHPSAHASPAQSSAAMPLGPPPGLMDMRALSPPMSLLPDFSQGIPTLSLDAAAASLATTATTTTTTTKMTTTTTTMATVTAPSVSSSIAAAAATTAEERRKAAYAAASMLKKRKSSDAFASDTTASTTLPTNSYITAAASTSSTPSTSTSTSTAVTPSSSLSSSSSSAVAVSAAAAAAANLQNLVREKVMKEPQSGDLYECVITKRNGGLGLTLACVDDHVQITGLAPDTPAANSGICVGDTLVAVSGLPVRGLQFSTVIGRLKSSSRNSVVLKLRRNPFRHNANGNGHPYRTTGNANSNGVGMGLKRPAHRPMAKTPESNSANVLSTSKSMALETRLAGGPMGSSSSSSSITNGSSAGSSSITTSAMDPSISSSITTTTTTPATRSTLTMGTTARVFHVKTEPTPSVYYFPSTGGITLLGESATTPQPAYRVAEEDRDRYFAEARRLRSELANSITWKRQERLANQALYTKFQEIASKFENEMQTIFQIGAETASSSSSSPSAGGAGGAAAATMVSSSKSHHEDLVALRQKLLEVNHALARQQTEILELKERDARHASHEMRRIKHEIIREFQQQMHEMVMLLASPETTPTMTTKPCETKIDGVRSSVFEQLFHQQTTASVAAKLAAARHHQHQYQHQYQHHPHHTHSSGGLLSIKEEQHAGIELELDLAQTAQVLSWNLQERLPARSLVVQVVGSCKIEYVTHEEALILRYQLELTEAKP